MPATTATHRLESADAERSVLGALLLDPDRYFDLAGDLFDADFVEPVHAAIFAAIRRLHEDRKAVDFVTVAEALKTDPAVQRAGGAALLAELAASVPTASHAAHYATIIRDHALHRQIREYGTRIAETAADTSLSASDVLERAEQQLLSLSRRGTAVMPRHIADIGAESYEHYTRLYEAEDKLSLFGLRTGFRDLDGVLTGMAPGNLIVIAARPGMGKSSLALDIARNVAALQSKTVAVLSLEMSRQEVMDRTIAGLLGIEAWKLKKGELTQEDFRNLGILFDGLKQHPLFIDDDPDTTIANIRSKARRQQMQHGLDLLIVDYLQLIEVTDAAASENRTQQVSYISRSLKNLARELQCPVIALSQLSRAVEQRNPPIPVLADLRESGAIEQDADVVLMLYREEAYNEDCGSPGSTDLFIRKNRNGPTGRVSLHFDKRKMSFRDAKT